MKNKEYKKGIATGVLVTVIVAGGAKIAGNFLTVVYRSWNIWKK